MKKKANVIFLIIIVFITVVTLQVYSAEKKQTKTITYASLEWIPFSYIGEKGESKGLYFDILKEIFEIEMNIKLNFQILPWKRAQLNVKNGKADLLLTVATQNRLEYAIKTELPILQLYLYAYTYKNHPKFDEINTVSSGINIKQLNLIPVTNLGNNWHKNNIDNYGVKTHYVPSEEIAFMFLASKRADITIEPLYAGSHLINKLKLSDKVVQSNGKFGPIIFHLLIGKKSLYSEKIEQINHAIKKVKKSNRYQEILNNYERIH